MEDKHPYAALSPEVILHATEALAGAATGAVFALNSYENRVYQVELESGEYVIAKFYRPGRWSEKTILEDHMFTKELLEADIPVVAPLEYSRQTLFKINGFYYALYPKRGGRPFEVRHREDLRELGRLAARVHNIGACQSFMHRPQLNTQSFGQENINFILNNNMLPEEIKLSFEAISGHVLKACATLWQQINPEVLRLHGDCHAGNILVHTEPFLVDLDDCLSGPAMQDLWMLLPGEEEEAAHALETLIEGYEVFRPFPYHEKPLIEVLRTLRMLHYTAWLAKRWHDPTFPKNFPFFSQTSYWQGFIGNLQQQLSRLSMGY